MGDRADALLTHTALRHVAAIVIEDRKIDEWLRRRAGRQRLGEIIFVDDAATDGVGFGEAIAEQRLGVAHILRQSLHMFGRTRRAAARIAPADRTGTRLTYSH